MKKHVAVLCAAALLASGIGAVPGTSSAAPGAATAKKTELSNEGTDAGSAPDGSGGSDSGTKETGNTLAAVIDKVIAEGMKYIGTPYLFGSNRGTTETFDCSDFVRWIYKEKAGIVIPLDSRQQGAFVKKLGTAKSDWHSLKRGDLMFFMTYKGSTAADYKGVDRSTERITHVALYLGDGKILHTYSNASGGVHVQAFADSQWEHRFLFGGSVLTEK